MLKNVILMAVFIVYMSLLYFCNSVFAMKKATDADMYTDWNCTSHSM